MVTTVFDLMEQVAIEHSRFIAEATGTEPPGSVIAAISAALSLKRIADMLERMDLTQPTNSYGETIGECIQGQLERGLKGIPNR